jgi:hypothetical protein
MSGPALIWVLNLQKHDETISPQNCKCEETRKECREPCLIPNRNYNSPRQYIQYYNLSAKGNHLGLDILVASAGGAYLVTAQRISAAFA